MRDVIFRSWQRCHIAGVNPYDTGLHRQLQGENLARALVQREKLLTVAHPFMADLYAIVRGTGFVVVLADEEGYILELFGDEGAGAAPMTSNFFVGASWHERDAGTNAIGTALEEQCPVQVTGPEHYCRKHHCLTCSAAPLFDPDNKLIGILDISGAHQGAHTHTLGMVVAAAKAKNAKRNFATGSPTPRASSSPRASTFKCLDKRTNIVTPNKIGPAAKNTCSQRR